MFPLEFACCTAFISSVTLLTVIVLPTFGGDTRWQLVGVFELNEGVETEVDSVHDVVVLIRANNKMVRIK